MPLFVDSQSRKRKKAPLPSKEVKRMGKFFLNNSSNSKGSGLNTDELVPILNNDNLD